MKRIKLLKVKKAYSKIRVAITKNSSIVDISESKLKETT